MLLRFDENKYVLDNGVVVGDIYLFDDYGIRYKLKETIKDKTSIGLLAKEHRTSNKVFVLTHIDLDKLDLVGVFDKNKKCNQFNINSKNLFVYVKSIKENFVDVKNRGIDLDDISVSKKDYLKVDLSYIRFVRRNNFVYFPKISFEVYKNNKELFEEANFLVEQFKFKYRGLFDDSEMSLLFNNPCISVSVVELGSDVK